MENENKSRLGYLSAALRVSTYPEAEAAGPRSHILGVISGFKKHNWIVEEFIVGNKMPRERLKQGGSATIGQSRIRILISDILRIAFSLRNSRRGWREIGGNVDWVYERIALLQAFGPIFQRRGNIPWILETNGILFYEAKFERKTLILYRVARYFELRSYRKCDVLVCITDTLKDLLVSQYHIDPSKIVVIHNGVDIDFFNPNKHVAKRHFKDFTVGYVGGVIERQGIELAIESISELKNEGLKVNFVVVGSGNSLENCQALAKKLGVDDQIHFAGLVSRDDIPSYIAGFDFGYSGQLKQKIGKMYHSPLKLYEYMAMGIPVIASDFENSRNLVDSENFGQLFSAGDKQSLKNAIREAHKKFKLDTFTEQSLMIRQMIVENHSWDKRVEDIIEFASERLS